jgi:hypothetical protein
MKFLEAQSKIALMLEQLNQEFAYEKIIQAKVVVTINNDAPTTIVTTGTSNTRSVIRLENEHINNADNLALTISTSSRPIDAFITMNILASTGVQQGWKIHFSVDDSKNSLGAPSENLAKAWSILNKIMMQYGFVEMKVVKPGLNLASNNILQCGRQITVYCDYHLQKISLVSLTQLPSSSPDRVMERNTPVRNEEYADIPGDAPFLYAVINNDRLIYIDRYNKTWEEVSSDSNIITKLLSAYILEAGIFKAELDENELESIKEATGHKQMNRLPWNKILLEINAKLMEANINPAPLSPGERELSPYISYRMDSRRYTRVIQLPSTYNIKDIVPEIGTIYLLKKLNTTTPSCFTRAVTTEITEAFYIKDQQLISKVIKEAVVPQPDNAIELSEILKEPTEITDLNEIKNIMKICNLSVKHLEYNPCCDHYNPDEVADPFANVVIPTTQISSSSVASSSKDKDKEKELEGKKIERPCFKGNADRSTDNDQNAGQKLFSMNFALSSAYFTTTGSLYDALAYALLPHQLENILATIGSKSADNANLTDILPEIAQATNVNIRVSSSADGQEQMYKVNDMGKTIYLVQTGKYFYPLEPRLATIMQEQTPAPSPTNSNNSCLNMLLCRS